MQLAEAHPELEPADVPRYPFEGVPEATRALAGMSEEQLLGMLAEAVPLD